MQGCGGGGGGVAGAVAVAEAAAAAAKLPQLVLLLLFLLYGFQAYNWAAETRCTPIKIVDNTTLTVKTP